MTVETFRARLEVALAEEAQGEVVFLEGSDFGDGLPLVRPDDRAIDEMLDGRDPDHAAIDGAIPIAFATPCWWDLAACAVLAGCRAGSLDLIGATVDAVTDPVFNLLGVQTTTGAAAPLVIVGGDAVNRFGLNAGPNSLGPGHRANATIGRAVRLVLQAVGRCAPGEGDMATQGHPGKFTWLVAENRLDNPWARPPAQGRVTVFAGVGNVEVVMPGTTVEEASARLSQVLSGVGAAENVVLLPPESADFFDRAGWDETRLRDEIAAATGCSPHVVVTGGPGIKATVIPGWGGGSTPVSREIR